MEFQKTLLKYKKNFLYKNLPNVDNKVNNIYYKYFIIIPIYNELDFIIDTLDSIDRQNKNYLIDTLVVLVINNSKDDANFIKENNKSTEQKIRKQDYNYEYIILDYFSKKNALDNNNSGVGVSRKIGMDFIIKYAKENSLIFSLDADTLVHPKYLEIISNYFSEKKIKACTVNFRHQHSYDKDLEKGIRKYEKTLKLIAKKIKNAGSPYGYVSMGSTIVCTVQAYIAVGGMSKKKATEDFYFLQSLAKYTAIAQISKILVYPSARCEERVYLGTGHSMVEYKNNNDFNKLKFSNISFINLKFFLNIIYKYIQHDFQFVFKKLESKIDKKSIKFLKENHFSQIWNKMNKPTLPISQRKILFDQWFDALKVIKFLKQLS